MSDDYDLVALDGSGSVLRTHGPSECAGPVCCIHKPSDHHMATWPQVWRADRHLMERRCEHGVGHPDPDDLSIQRKVPGVGTHGCDGCCFGAHRAGERR